MESRLQLASAISRLGTETAFEVVNRVGALEAQGQKVLKLHIGAPDFRTPEHVVEAGRKALADGFHGYTPAKGLPQVREVVADYCQRFHGGQVHPDQVIIVPGRAREQAKGGAPAPEPLRGARGARAVVAAKPTRPEAERPDAALKRQKSEDRKRAAQLAAVENAITALEQRLTALGRALEDAGAGSDVVRVRALGSEYNEVQAELTARLGEWETLAA